MKKETILKTYEEAVAAYDPKITIAMVSGGKDSMAAYHASLEAGIKIDFAMHVNTRTGIRQTTEFVREYFSERGEYLEADAGSAYEDYLFRKGFFGKGRKAHNFAYHLLKAGPLRKKISEIRQRRRNFNTLLINGARHEESNNRKKNLARIKMDKGNVWCSVIADWTREDRDRYLESRNIDVNPVSKALCRSGECMCGTMQSKEQRVEASLIYPEWGQWLDDLEAEVKKKFPWGWHEDPPRSYFNGQLDLWQPMCVGCEKNFQGE